MSGIIKDKRIVGYRKNIIFLTDLRLFRRSSYRRKIMIITFTAKNIDGEKNSCFLEYLTY